MGVQPVRSRADGKGMGGPSSFDLSLGVRLAAAGATADRETEVGIQRVRGWCLVVALIQTALYPGQFWYLAWGAMALLFLNWAWVRWALAAEQGPRLNVIGVVAMATDTLAVIMIMANLMATPDDPVQLLPLALALEAAFRWGRIGGIVGGVAGGVLLTLWSWGTHYRNDIETSPGYAGFRFGVVVLIGAIVGHAVAESRRQRRAAEAVFQASRDLMATFRADGSLVAANPAAAEVLGYEPDELTSLDRPLLGEPGARGGPLVDPAAGPQRVVRQVAHREGHRVWLELDLVPDPGAGLVYAIGRDVSDRSRAESELRHRVDHDGLTGAWNRHSLVAYLHRMLTRGYLPALVFVDLDRFKDINDRHGHLAGDAVIVELGRRLADAASHEGSVARYAGDEFCIVVDDPDDVAEVAERTRAAFAEPFDVGRDALVVSGSVGVAVARSGDTPEALVHRADQDMYRVKQADQLPG
ncbi:MAG: GGDEF domain-containing protein [Acidimicrobiales bacterium]|nr:GGDEF domain-containing protein [Acidimicrobiales bacterium]